jgi:vesicle-fusing ATPase
LLLLLLLLQVVSPENLVGFMEQPKASNITKVFEDAYKSPLSIVILVRVSLSTAA